MSDELARKLDDMMAQTLRLESRVNSWSRNLGTVPSVVDLKADQAEFINPPIETARFRLTSTQESSASTWTKVEWDEETWNDGIVNYSTVSPGTFTYPIPSEAMALMMTGYLRWDGNSSGERLVRFTKLTTYGPKYRMISDAPPAGTNPVAEPFCFVHWIDDDSSGFKFETWQNGEPGLDLQAYGGYLGIAKIARRTLHKDTTRTVSIQPSSQIGRANEHDKTSVAGTTLFIQARDTSATTKQNIRGFIKFDLDEVPSGADVVSADLELYLIKSTDNTSVAENIEVYRAQAAWDPATLNWNNMPANDSTAMGSASTIASTGMLWKWSLSTAQFSSWLSSDNYGAMMKMSNENIGSTNPEHYAFYQNGSTLPFFYKRPRLLVKYLE